MQRSTFASGESNVPIAPTFRPRRPCAAPISHGKRSAEPLGLGATETGAVSASIGVAVRQKDGSDAGELMRIADEAMYAAKRAGKNATRGV